jgi:hypothetical protein
LIDFFIAYGVGERFSGPGVGSAAAAETGRPDEIAPAVASDVRRAARRLIRESPLSGFEEGHVVTSLPPNRKRAVSAQDPFFALHLRS